MEVKICDIKNIDEAIKICELHPDGLGVHIGFNDNISSDNISKAKDIVRAIRSYNLKTFLLTDKIDAKTNIFYSNEINNSHIQLVGDISPSEIIKIKKALPRIIIVKVIHVTGRNSINLAKKYENCEGVDMILLDSKIDDKLGGTGRVHDWGISREIRNNCSKPIWLAGGLSINNLREAISIVKPDGVDVQSSIKNIDGSKNYDLIRDFISICKITH